MENNEYIEADTKLILDEFKNSISDLYDACVDYTNTYNEYIFIEEPTEKDFKNRIKDKIKRAINIYE